MKESSFKLCHLDIKNLLHDYAFCLGGLRGEAFFSREAACLAKFIEALDSGAASIDKKKSTSHFTASGFVVDLNNEKIAINHHKKHQRWQHFGGHVECKDLSVFAAARREVLEESGLTTLNHIGADELWLNSTDHAQPCAHPLPFDLQVIGLGSEHVDYDIRYLFLGDSGYDLTVSSESVDVKWVDLANIGHYIDRNNDILGFYPVLAKIEMLKKLKAAN